MDAFSTLGLTKDPVYSFMQKYSPFEIASLIIHEQTHATLWVKDQPDFNEELANFVGEEGAFEWMRARYGVDSPAYRDALDEYADSQTFVRLLQGLTKDLKVLYGEGISPTEKLAGKKKIIDEFQASLSGELGAAFRSNAYRHLPDLHINNAFLSLYSLYSEDVPLLRTYWERRCDKDLRVFMQDAVALAKKGDVKAQMREELD